MAASRPRETISTFGGGDVASAHAASTMGLYGITLPPRMPASAAISSLGRASSMRSARLCAAKPPNTTECTAPMRAQASIANTASAMFGM